MYKYSRNAREESRTIIKDSVLISPNEYLNKKTNKLPVLDRLYDWGKNPVESGKLMAKDVQSKFTSDVDRPKLFRAERLNEIRRYRDRGTYIHEHYGDRILKHLIGSFFPNDNEAVTFIPGRILGNTHIPLIGATPDGIAITDGGTENDFLLLLDEPDYNGPGRPSFIHEIKTLNKYNTLLKSTDVEMLMAGDPDVTMKVLVDALLKGDFMAPAVKKESKKQTNILLQNSRNYFYKERALHDLGTFLKKANEKDKHMYDSLKMYINKKRRTVINIYSEEKFEPVYTHVYEDGPVFLSFRGAHRVQTQVQSQCTRHLNQDATKLFTCTFQTTQRLARPFATYTFDTCIDREEDETFKTELLKLLETPKKLKKTLKIKTDKKYIVVNINRIQHEGISSTEWIATRKYSSSNGSSC